MKHTYFVRWTAIAATGVLTTALTAGVSTQQAPSAGPSRNFAKELSNKLTGSFTVTTAGSLLAIDTAGRQAGEALRKALRESDTTVGHVDFFQADARRPGSPGSPFDLTKDLQDLGFDLLAPGAAQGGDVALRTSLDALAEAGLAVVKSDYLPVFHNLAQGRVALVSGPNPVSQSTQKFVTPEQLEQLKQIRDAIVARRTEPDVSRPVGVPNEPPNQVTIFADTYVSGPVAGEIRDEPNAGQRQAAVLSVRNSKEFSDFTVFSMPAQEGQSHFASGHQPTKFVVDLAHEMVNNGMDMFVAQSGHVVQGVEIYKGRPIFYGLGDLAVHRSTPGATPAHLIAVVATSKYQDGVLTEVRLLPVDLGVDPSQRPASKLGVPLIAAPDVAARILGDIQKYSAGFGTTIAIENGVGVIRIPREATTAIGEGVRDFGPPAASAGGGRAGGRGRGGRGGGVPQ